MLPDKANGVQLARDITSLALVFGITIDSFSFHDTSGGTATAVSPPGDTSGPPAALSAPVLDNGILELVISFKASYPDFMSFTRELEKSLELSDVVALSLGGGAKTDTKTDTKSADSKTTTSNNGANMYQFGVTLHTYFLK